MGVPQPITQPDLNIRTHTAFDLEKTLVAFLEQLFASARLDNPTLNLAQATQPAHPIYPADPPQVSYDPTERAQTLVLKVPPRVARGRIPRTVTGEIAIDRLPDCPSIIVQAVSAKVQVEETIVTVRILVTAYDENPDSGGYQDVLNMIEAMAIALTTFGTAALDEAYPMLMPFEWHLVEPDAFPHFLGELTTTWQLPSATPGPPLDYGAPYGVPVPAEHIELRPFAMPPPTL